MSGLYSKLKVKKLYSCGGQLLYLLQCNETFCQALIQRNYKYAKKKTRENQTKC